MAEGTTSKKTRAATTPWPMMRRWYWGREEKRLDMPGDEELDG
jgi:hypothetical protein